MVRFWFLLDHLRFYIYNQNLVNAIQKACTNENGYLMSKLKSYFDILPKSRCYSLVS